MSALLAVAITLAGWQIAMVVSVAVIVLSYVTEPPPAGMWDFTSGLRTLAVTVVLAAVWAGYLVARILG